MSSWRLANCQSIDSHCHLADEAFAADLDARSFDAARGTPGSSAALVILEAGNAEEAAQAERVEQLWPEVRFSIGVHPHQAHRVRRRSRARRRPGRASSVPQRRRRVPSARSASTTTTTTRRATCSRRCFARSSALALRARLAGGHPHPGGRRGHDRHPPRRGRRRPPARRAALLHRDRRRCATPASTLGFYISLAGIRDVSESGGSARNRPRRAAGSPPDRNRQSVSGARAAPRQAQRAGLRRPRGRGPGRAAPGRRPASWPGARRRTSTPCSGRDKVLN